MDGKKEKRENLEGAVVRLCKEMGVSKKSGNILEGAKVVINFRSQDKPIEDIKVDGSGR